jgi:hypothetical protein
VHNEWYGVLIHLFSAAIRGQLVILTIGILAFAIMACKGTDETIVLVLDIMYCRQHHNTYLPTNKMEAKTVIWLKRMTESCVQEAE